MRLFQTISATIAVFISLTFPSFSQPDCQGDTRQEHHVGNFNFVTSSWTESVEGRTRYVSCVANLDPGSDLLVNWFIPGPYKHYVPASRPQKTSRLKDDGNARPIAGCLQYGGLGGTTTADFLGTAEDAEKHGNGDCAAQAANLKSASLQGSPLPSDGYADEVQVYFPSDLSNPYDTMLELTGKVGFSVSDGVYNSFFNYFVQPLEGRTKGQIGDVRVEPYFPVAGEAFLAAYAKFNESGPKTLDKEGSIAFQVPGAPENNWRAVEAYYQFIDREDRVVALVPMPLLQDVGK